MCNSLYHIIFIVALTKPYDIMHCLALTVITIYGKICLASNVFLQAALSHKRCALLTNIPIDLFIQINKIIQITRL